MPITAEEFTRQLDGAHARLLNQRETRRNRFFRDGLLGNGEIEIASETFHPADILAAMAAETCRIARAESDGKYSEETLRRSCYIIRPPSLSLSTHSDTAVNSRWPGWASCEIRGKPP